MRILDSMLSHIRDEGTGPEVKGALTQATLYNKTESTEGSKTRGSWLDRVEGEGEEAEAQMVRALMTLLEWRLVVAYSS